MNKIEDKAQSQAKADKVLKDHIVFSIIAGAIPIPIADLAAVTIIQLEMVKQLAKAYGVDYSDEQGKSIVSAIFASSLGTTAGRAGASAVKAIPVVGTILGITSQSTMSGISTYAVGKLFDRHFSNNGTLESFDAKSLKEAFQELLKSGKDVVEKFKKDIKKNEKEAKKATMVYIEDLRASGSLSEEDSDIIKKNLGGEKDD